MSNKLNIYILLIIFGILLIPSDIFADVWPVHDSHPLTSAFGPRFVYDDPSYDFHNGIDIGVYQVPVYSTDAWGIAAVVDRIDDSDEGIWVRISHDVPGHEPETFYTIYCHLREIVEGLQPGNPIPETDTYIGVSGNTGDVPYHLHYGFRPIPSDPVDGHINPLHNLSYTNSGEPLIIEVSYAVDGTYEPNPVPGDNITHVQWRVRYPSTDLDLNEAYVAFYYSGAWHSINSNFDTRENSLEDNFFEGNIASLHISPWVYPYPAGYKTIDYMLGFLDPPIEEMQYPIDGIVGIVINDIAMPRCDDCVDVPLLPDCWWGNPNCGSPTISVATFSANLTGNQVIISWELHTTIGLMGVNIWKSENLDGPFNKITETPFPVDTDNGRYELIDPNIENGHEYFYKLQFVLDDGTEIFVEDLIASTSVISLPVSTSLGSVYPNPFNNQTLISFTIGNDQTDQIELTIYNTLGQKIRCLANGGMSAGSYTVLFDGKDDIGQRLASGVYLVNMQYGSYLETRKISILK